MPSCVNDGRLWTGASEISATAEALRCQSCGVLVFVKFNDPHRNLGEEMGDDLRTAVDIADGRAPKRGTIVLQQRIELIVFPPCPNYDVELGEKVAQQRDTAIEALRAVRAAPPPPTNPSTTAPPNGGSPRETA